MPSAWCRQNSRASASPNSSAKWRCTPLTVAQPGGLYKGGTASLAASRGSTPAERRAWRADVYAIIAAMTSLRPRGDLTVERMCVLAGVSRAGYYRWRASAPRQEETAVRDALQRVALANRSN